VEEKKKSGSQSKFNDSLLLGREKEKNLMKAKVQIS